MFLTQSIEYKCPKSPAVQMNMLPRWFPAVAYPQNSTWRRRSHQVTQGHSQNQTTEDTLRLPPRGKAVADYIKHFIHSTASNCAIRAFMLAYVEVSFAFTALVNQDV